MHGFLNVNKPAGMSSFAVVKRVRKYFKKRRVGHLGTLDPMAEGVLPIAVGAATRIIEFIMDVPKGGLRPWGYRIRRMPGRTYIYFEKRDGIAGTEEVLNLSGGYNRFLHVFRP